ncbi:MAG: hypothetical protein WHT84_06265 [Breznakiellaceae bacterium]
MISREDFVFTIGYDGPVAVVDGQAKKRYGSLSIRELAEKGLFRAAYASALYHKMYPPAHNPQAAEEELRTFAEIYNRVAGTNYGPDAPFDRLFGVFPIEVQKVKIL